MIHTSERRPEAPLRVFVAMSGGVDSSVAALVLVRAGHEVTGVTMLLTPDDAPGACCGSASVRDAKRTCAQLGVPHLTVDLRETFERDVVAPFAAAYAAGRTPNPCIACNDLLKFGPLLERALAHGADVLATGHYARVVERRDGSRALARGLDATRDQSYFLYRLTPAQLERVVFPLGELTKAEVRTIAAEAGLPAATSAESREICFVADDAERVALVTARHPSAGESGPVLDAEGERVGTHGGVARYTVGQRKGFGSAGTGGPAYVTRIDAEGNTIVVGSADDLEVTEVLAADAVWSLPEDHAEDLTCAVRYNQVGVPCRAEREGTRLRVVARSPLRGVAPGQAVVCYEGDVVAGGGVVV